MKLQVIGIEPLVVEMLHANAAHTEHAHAPSLSLEPKATLGILPAAESAAHANAESSTLLGMIVSEVPWGPPVTHLLGCWETRAEQ